MDIGSEVLLKIGAFNRQGINLAAAFSYRLIEKHDSEEAVILANIDGYLTILVRRKSDGQLDYIDRNYVETVLFPLYKTVERETTENAAIRQITNWSTKYESEEDLIGQLGN
ncbi:hypothetical protein ACLI4Q_20135 [Natrialbaceae archaeon A-CW1-1]